MNLRRFKILKGQFANQVVDGIDIGYQDYPEQFAKESFTYQQHQKRYETHNQAIWLNEPQVRVERTDPRNVKITPEGVNYSNDFIDLCTPFDRYSKEIFVGDELYVAVKNEVRKATVTKIAEKPFQASYGIMWRKLTVKDDNGYTITINDYRTTIKA